MGEPRVVKRYANRKLYDTRASRYVTLDQISELIRAGDDVAIIDNTTKEDLTSVTLAQIIFEEEKKQRSFLSLQAMRNIIQSGGERIEELVTHAQRRVSGVFLRKAGGDGAAAGDTAEAPELGPAGDERTEGPMACVAACPEAQADGAAGAGGVPINPSRLLHEFREWLLTTQRSIDEWQRSIDGRIRHVLLGISPLSSVQREVAALAGRLEELEKRLEAGGSIEGMALPSRPGDAPSDGADGADHAATGTPTDGSKPGNSKA